jgi:hypothetical protein
VSAARAPKRIDFMIFPSSAPAVVVERTGVQQDAPSAEHLGGSQEFCDRRIMYPGPAPIRSVRQAARHFLGRRERFFTARSKDAWVESVELLIHIFVWVESPGALALMSSRRARAAIFLVGSSAALERPSRLDGRPSAGRAGSMLGSILLGARRSVLPRLPGRRGRPSAAGFVWSGLHAPRSKNLAGRDPAAEGRPTRTRSLGGTDRLVVSGCESNHRTGATGGRPSVNTPWTF